MPTVECDKFDCNNHGYDICIAKRVKFENGDCLAYEQRLGKSIVDAPFNPHCSKRNGAYRSSKVTNVLK